MAATIIDGKAIAEQERLQIAAEVARLQERDGREPGLAVVLVGNDPASETLCCFQGTPDQRRGHALI
jgi:methylenetetrahydrofolate dehydrogenase (NADP+) / methenyltetrahydrofolate cyclohydrolase